MHSSLRSWVKQRGVAVSVAALVLLPGIAGAGVESAEGASAAQAEVLGAPLGEAGSSEAPGVDLLSLRAAVAARLDAPLRAKFEQMSNDAIGALMDAPEGAQHTDEEQAIRLAVSKELFERQLEYQTGDIQIGDGLATLRLGEDFRYLNAKDAEKLLVEAWGNPPGMQTLGMIVPADVSPLDDAQGWAVVISYSEEGHVKDDDADDIDYDELLDDMKRDTRASNEQRVKEGYGKVELVGWAAPPRYDAATHRLYWAKELKFEGASENTVNYAIRVLGRKGVLELNAVASMSQIASVARDMELVLPRAEFASGSRYTDFDPDLDKVAAYGLGGLIAGKVLAKAGFFAVLLKLLIASKKLVIVGVIGIGALISKVLRGRNSAG